MREIKPDTAKLNYGVRTNHEFMDNGQARFRLISSDGSSYIRTVACDNGTWENSHFHKFTTETYIVQKGWMALAKMVDGRLNVTINKVGETVTTEKFISHNVYTPANAVLHIVKSGTQIDNDWFRDPKLDALTKNLSESETIDMAQKNNYAEIDHRFNAYVTIYNNLDSLLWKVPGIILAAASILVGFLAGIVSKPFASPSPVMVAVILLFTGLIFIIGAYSMMRLRMHHTRMGNALRDIEPSGYFHIRAETTNRIFPPGAPLLVIVIFMVLAIMLIVLGTIALQNYSALEPYFLPQILKKP